MKTSPDIMKSFQAILEIMEHETGRLAAGTDFDRVVFFKAIATAMLLLAKDTNQEMATTALDTLLLSNNETRSAFLRRLGH